MPKKSKTPTGRAELADTDAGVTDDLKGAEDARREGLSLNEIHRHYLPSWTREELDMIDPEFPIIEKPEGPGLRREIIDLRAKLARAEAALAPFAELGRAALATLSEHAKPEYVWYQLNDAKITNGDLQAAVDALAEA